MVGVYVDDLVITGTNEEEVEAFKAEIKAAFQMSDLGLLSFCPGSRSTRTTPASPFARPPTPSASSSWVGSSVATQLTLPWRRG